MYIELHTSSAFSFLEAASLPEALVDQAARYGYSAIALLDRDGVYGAPALSSRRPRRRHPSHHRRRAHARFAL